MIKIILKTYIFLIFTGLFLSCSSVYASISSVGYIHDTIYSTKGITVPIDPGQATTDISTVKYLMTQIDQANYINTGVATNYASTADTIPVDATLSLANITSLIPINGFSVTVSSVSSFNFYISAAGNFKIEWGDGTETVLTKTNTTNTSYSHTYSATGTYTIKLTGLATDYDTSSTTTAAISFYSSTNKTSITGIDGNLGIIFPYTNSKSPSFYQTFYGCSGLTGTIPSGLFSGMNAAPRARMFEYTFSGTALTGSIPSNLFSGVVGAPQTYMFSNTFLNCTGLTGVIPSGLFSGISGAPGTYMFQGTFRNCTGLTGIGGALFSGVSGAPAARMYYDTFNGCTGLLGSIPSGLFGSISGAPAEYMYRQTFLSCSGLTGSIPSGLFGTINGTAAIYIYYKTFSGCSGLTGTIPAGLFGTLTGAPGSNMFYYTFQNCSGLTGIANGIWNLSGLTNTSVTNMFAYMFIGCTNITSASPSVSSSDSTKLWTKFTAYSGGAAFRYCTNMSDYASIPSGWK